jgi:hypothetical protein
MRLRPGPLLRVLFPTAPHRPPAAKPLRARRARAALACGLLVVAAAQVGLSVAVETVRPEWRDPEYGHRLLKLEALRAAHPGRPLVLALGSSRTQMALSPADMGFAGAPGAPLVYNFGQAGAGPVHMLLTFDRLRDAGVKPAFVLLEFFPAALTTDGPAEQVFKTWGPRLGVGDLRRLAPYCADPTALRREWAANRVAPWYALRLTLMSHWQPGWLPWFHQRGFLWEQLDAHGCSPFPYQPVHPDARAAWVAQARDQYGPALGNYRIGTSSDRALRELVGRCRAAGVPVALYITPEGPAFRSWYAPQTRQTLDAYLAALRTDLAVPVFDATAGFVEEDFADGHHLLKGSAARFSRTLAAEYLRGWVGDR